MIYIKQDDFDNFKCIAGECPSSCCTCWQIVIDDDSLEKYKSIKDDFKRRIDLGIDFEEGIFRQNGRRCAMLNQNGLCDLQTSQGEEALCYTCRVFPRHVEEYEGVREYSLSLSCPEAARMAIERKDKISLIELSDDTEEEFEDFDYLLYTKLLDAREIAFCIAQNREIGLFDRITALNDFAEQMQEKLDDDELFALDEVIEDFKNRQFRKPETDLEILDFSQLDDPKILGQMEYLTDDWDTILDRAIELYENNGSLTVDKYEKTAAEQILTLLIYTYFCGATYDGWIFSKMKLATTSVWWIILISKATELTLTEATYRYCKEIEHSDLNLNALEEYFMQLY